MKRTIVTDSSSDLTSLKITPLSVVPLKIITDEKQYIDDEALDPVNMLSELEKYKGRSRSSCPNPDEYLEAFGDADEVFCVTITSGLSGSYNSAAAAAKMFEQSGDDKRALVIDSLSTGPESALVLEKIEELTESGLPFEEIKEKELPELDDEFASEVSEYDTFAEYKESVKTKIADRKTAAAKNAKEEAVVEAVIADAKMDIPDAMVETTQRQMVEEFAQRMQSQGISMEQYMQFTGMTPQMLLEQVKPQALTKIQSRLVLEAIVKAEGIEATEEEFQSDIKEMADMYKMEVERALEVLGENGKKQVMEDIAIRKAVAFVVENAKEAKPAAKTAACSSAIPTS